MIGKEDKLFLGTISKPHGTKGLLLIRLRNFKAEELKKMEWVFVEIDGLPVPYFMEEFRENSGETIIVKFGEIDSEMTARALSGCEVFISGKNIKRNKRKVSDTLSISGYRVIDRKLGFVGIAQGITEITSNPQLNITNNEREWLIPAHEDIICEINQSKREIIIDAPDGLFDL